MVSNDVFTDSPSFDFPQENTVVLPSEQEQMPAPSLTDNPENSENTSFSDTALSVTDIPIEDNSEITGTPDSGSEASPGETVPAETVYSIDDIYTLLETCISSQEYSVDDIYTLLEICFPVPLDNAEQRDVYSYLDIMEKNQQTSIALLKVQNSMLLIMFLVLVLICAFVFARIVWRKF